MKIIPLILMSISLLLSCFVVVSALKKLRHVSRTVFRRTLAGFVSFLCLYIALVFSLLDTFKDQVIEWIFFQWGFVPMFGLLAMAGIVVSGVNEAYKQGKKDGGIGA